VPLAVVEDPGDGGITVRRARLGDYVEAARILASLVPPGRVASYSWVARMLGVSPRLAGRALALNPDPIVYPCHRIVRSDGGLGGYSRGGPRVKEALLRLEGVPVHNGRVDPAALVEPLELPSPAYYQS